MICKRFLVEGRVQGVFFRQSTRNVARELGVTGWCRNLDDGRVEVCACGDEATLNQFRSWLRCGPRAARVDKVNVALVEMPVPADFDIRL
ncbi:MAG: acylphosphatase [Proteobacteria bacterium]|nr:MAG: acylphosphatase [Pseudomonadota bacterium]